MITYLDVEDLLDYRSEKQPVVSFYLNTDGSRFPFEQQKITGRNLLREGRKTVETGPWDDQVRSKLRGDLDLIGHTLEEELTPGSPHRGLVIFAGQETNLWRIFRLPRPIPSNLVLENSPYVRPLTLILDEYHRFGVVIMGGNRAEFYEVYIGEILKLENVFPAETSVGAVISLAPPERPGSGDRGMSKRVEEGLQKHFRQVADALFHLFHRRHYEYLVMGGQQQLLAQFEHFLHPTLNDHLAGTFSAEPGKIRSAKILEEVNAIERRIEIKNERRLVEQLINSAHSRGMGVLGLEEVLTALQMGAVHMLLIQDNWHTPGEICRNCGHFGVDLKVCPGCGAKTTKVTDMVDEVIETAIKTSSIIEHVHPEAGLAEHGHIGAILRFKI